MDDDETISIEKKHAAAVYAKRPLVIDRGQGAIVFDRRGNKYVDCTGSYGVAIVGHSHPRIVKAIQDQAEKLLSCHGSFYNETRSILISKIMKIAPSPLTKVFLSNSGAEAVECAIKLARKFTGKKEIVACMGGFHGKTFGALTATWGRKYRDPFQPLVPNFKHIPFGNIDKAKEAITADTAGIIVEPVQGESGVRLPPDGYLAQLREVCHEAGVLLICDEIQTGFGRTGKLFASQNWNVTPDIMCLAKGVAGGLPVGVTLAREDIMSSLKVGEHTSTYSGNPLIAAAASAAIDVLIEERLPDRAAIMGEHFAKRLMTVRDKTRAIREIRGLGLMIGVECRFDVLSVIMKSIERGVLVLDAGRNILRFLPPLVIQQSELDFVADVLEEVLEEEVRGRLQGPASI